MIYSQATAAIWHFIGDFHANPIRSTSKAAATNDDKIQFQSQEI
jgi:hypothetical protein